MAHGRWLFIVGVLGMGAAAPGCFTNTCLYTVCDGPYCRCSVSTCGEGAEYDNRIRRCRCLPGRELVGGHCLSREVANTYCGAGYHWQNGGCTPNQSCNSGEEIDYATGRCIPREQVNQVAQNLGINVGPGQRLGCPLGQKLVIEGPSAACVPVAQTCARDETWDGRSCAKAPAPCPEGAVWDGAVRQCVAFAKESPSEGLAVNVPQWAYANYGPDGGNGTAAFCNAFTKKPWSFGVNEGSSAIVRVSVRILVQDLQIARATVQTQSVFAGSGNAVPMKGAGEIDAAARAVIAPLIEQGGRATAPIAATTVRCLVVNAGRPAPVPATGGL